VKFVLIDIDVDEVYGVDVLENEAGVIECAIGIGDPAAEGATVLSLLAGWDSDLGKIDELIAGLQRFKTEAMAAAKKRTDAM